MPMIPVRQVERINSMRTAMSLRKLLIGLLCFPLFARVGPTLTPAETEARDNRSDKLRALIEASPKLPLQQTDLLIKLPKEQELGMVSWLAREIGRASCRERV